VAIAITGLRAPRLPAWPRGPARAAVQGGSALAVFAWACVVAASVVGDGGGGGGGTMAGHADDAHHAMGLTSAGLALWAVMVAAMMLPGTLPAVRHVAANSLCWRRGRAVALFLAVYGALWLGAGVALLAVATVAGRRTDAALAGALLLAAGWQLTRAKRRAVRDCHRSSPLPPRGRPATRGVIRFGLLYGGSCVRSCWALMLVMAVASSAPLAWMAVLTVATSIEKLVQRPRRATRAMAAALAVASLLATVSLVAGTSPAPAAPGVTHRGSTMLCPLPSVR
jgi:predicted metal-binding membrane protein